MRSRMWSSCSAVGGKIRHSDHERDRFYIRDVLNVLLNAAIVSATVHRVHKFASAVPSVRSFGVRPPASKDEDRENEPRATFIPTNEMYEEKPSHSPPILQALSGHRSTLRNFHSREFRRREEKNRTYIPQDRGDDIPMLRPIFSNAILSRELSRV